MSGFLPNVECHRDEGTALVLFGTMALRTFPSRANFRNNRELASCVDYYTSKSGTENRTQNAGHKS